MRSKNSAVSKVSTIRTESELRQAAREMLAADPLLSWRWTSTSRNEVLELTLDGGKLVFEPEFFLAPTARDLDRIRLKSQNHFTLLVAPSLSEVLVQHCRERGMSCLDLNGRQWVREKGTFVDRYPSGKRRFRPALATLDPFQPKSSRLVRALLSQPGRQWSQRDLAVRTGLSPGLVSRLIRHLVNEGLIGENDRAWSLLRRDALLDAWTAHDDWSKRTSIQQYSVLEAEPERLAQRALDALGSKEPLVFTQWFAANLRYPYTSRPVVSAYMNTFPMNDQTKSFGARRVDDGGSLWLIVPKDEGVFRETQQVGRFTLACDAQIYLDLLQVGLRGPDQAKALREWAEFGKDIA